MCHFAPGISTNTDQIAIASSMVISGGQGIILVTFHLVSLSGLNFPLTNTPQQRMSKTNGLSVTIGFIVDIRGS